MNKRYVLRVRTELAHKQSSVFITVTSGNDAGLELMVLSPALTEKSRFFMIEQMGKGAFRSSWWTIALVVKWLGLIVHG